MNPICCSRRGCWTQRCKSRCRGCPRVANLAYLTAESGVGADRKWTNHEKRLWTAGLDGLIGRHGGRLWGYAGANRTSTDADAVDCRHHGHDRTSRRAPGAAYPDAVDRRRHADANQAGDAQTDGSGYCQSWNDGRTHRDTPVATVHRHLGSTGPHQHAGARGSEIYVAGATGTTPIQACLVAEHRAARMDFSGRAG